MKGYRTANELDFTPVSVCFADESITVLFSQLLEVRGIRTTIVEDLSTIPENANIVTEPRLAATLKDGGFNRCLLVGKKESPYRDDP